MPKVNNETNTFDVSLVRRLATASHTDAETDAFSSKLPTMFCLLTLKMLLMNRILTLKILSMDVLDTET